MFVRLFVCLFVCLCLLVAFIIFLCRVGCGSFGEVYEGYWRNSVVAVKKIRIRTSGLSQEEKEEFQQEAAIMRYYCLLIVSRMLTKYVASGLAIR